MPDKASHIALAQRNQELIEKLIRDGNSHPEWVAVIAFYRALHIVDAVLFVDHPHKHGGSHDSRNQILKSTNKYRNIYQHYRPLFTASLIGRYLENYVDGEFSCFADYLTADEVVSQLVRHHLVQLQKSAEKIIGPLSPPSPASGAPPAA